MRAFTLLDEINSQLCRYKVALEEIAKMKPERVAEGFVTGPASLFMASQRIAREALKPKRGK